MMTTSGNLAVQAALRRLAQVDKETAAAVARLRPAAPAAPAAACAASPATPSPSAPWPGDGATTWATATSRAPAPGPGDWARATATSRAPAPGPGDWARAIAFPPAPSPDGDGDWARAVALSLASGPDDDDDLARAIALSLADSGASHKHEEELTERALDSVQTEQVPAFAEAGGTVRLGGQQFRLQDHGSAHGDHSNLCFYMAVTQGRGDLAVRLKEELAPSATAWSRDIGAHADFTGMAAFADTEVVRAYVLQKRVRAYVFNARAGVAVVHRTADCHGEVYLHTDGGHYQRLVPT